LLRFSSFSTNPQDTADLEDLYRVVALETGAASFKIERVSFYLFRQANPDDGIIWDAKKFRDCLSRYKVTRTVDVEHRGELVRRLMNWVMKGIVEIRQSNIPVPGMYGLFAARDLTSKDSIEYGGYWIREDLTPSKPDYHPVEDATYFYTVGSRQENGVEYTLSGYTHFTLSQPGRYANGFPWGATSDPEHRRAFFNNCGYRAKKDNNEIMYVVPLDPPPNLRSKELKKIGKENEIATIRKGEEIYCAYGPAYLWQTIPRFKSKMELHYLKADTLPDKQSEKMGYSPNYEFELVMLSERENVIWDYEANVNLTLHYGYLNKSPYVFQNDHARFNGPLYNNFPGIFAKVMEIFNNGTFDENDRTWIQITLKRYKTFHLNNADLTRLRAYRSKFPTWLQLLIANCDIPKDQPLLDILLLFNAIWGPFMLSDQIPFTDDDYDKYKQQTNSQKYDNNQQRICYLLNNGQFQDKGAFLQKGDPSNVGLKAVTLSPEDKSNVNNPYLDLNLRDIMVVATKNDLQEGTILTIGKKEEEKQKKSKTRSPSPEEEAKVDDEDFVHSSPEYNRLYIETHSKRR
jgi:hypothetical protein